MPSLYMLGRTVTFLNYLISFMYNCYILITRNLPDFQSNFIICYIQQNQLCYAEKSPTDKRKGYLFFLKKRKRMEGKGFELLQF